MFYEDLKRGFPDGVCELSHRELEKEKEDEEREEKKEHNGMDPKVP
ncbi:MAG: hypothetical protein GF387_03300 [Candidatus Portnoybacteria bacterium]|nr:hypothetical protein [Candidatus Portnoybacteria bacterium]